MARKNICISIRFNNKTMPLYEFLKTRKNTTAFIINELEKNKDFKQWKKAKTIEKKIDKIKEALEVLDNSASNPALQDTPSPQENTPPSPADIQALKAQYSELYDRFVETKNKKILFQALNIKYTLESLIGEAETKIYCDAVIKKYS